jgi:ribonuclease P protein component
MDQSFGKAYKLCSKKIIASLFKTGKQTKNYPFIVYTQPLEKIYKTRFQCVISVPKRNFKKAHDRNRIKRLIRECIRKNKLPLEHYLTTKDSYLALFLIYTAKEEIALEKLEKNYEVLIKKLIQHA